LVLDNKGFVKDFSQSIDEERPSKKLTRLAPRPGAIPKREPKKTNSLDVDWVRIWL
jgi:hypothetical protein